jgi:hypothetical protein
VVIGYKVICNSVEGTLLPLYYPGPFQFLEFVLGSGKSNDIKLFWFLTKLLSSGACLIIASNGSKLSLQVSRETWFRLVFLLLLGSVFAAHRVEGHDEAICFFRDEEISIISQQNYRVRVTPFPKCCR